MKKRKMYNIMPNFAAPSHAYWTHGDHLGSTAWVTDTAGAGVQHFRYLPFGEPLYSKKTGTFSSRYTFSGKERDAESGLNYFGARYYNSDLSLWLSVDPLADKYPNLSPYTYCADNPVRLVDEDGKYPITIRKGVLMFYSKTSGGIGTGYSLSGTYYTGRTMDKGGVTRFISSSLNCINNQNLNENSTNPFLFVGSGIGISENVAYFMNSNSFQEATSQNFLSISGGEGIGVNFGFGEGIISLGGGVDLGGGMDFGNLSNVAQSISLSYKEADNINNLSDVIAPSWTIEDITPNKNNTGRITGYNGTVYTKDSRGNKINTKIIVNCAIGKDGNSNNQWKSKEYENGVR